MLNTLTQHTIAFGTNHRVMNSYGFIKGEWEVLVDGEKFMANVNVPAALPYEEQGNHVVFQVALYLSNNGDDPARCLRKIKQDSTNA